MGCMVHVGILNENKKLTEKAKRKFIDEVKDVLKYGTEGIPDDSKPKFKCGSALPPDPTSAEALKDLEDEKKFPDFHKNTLGIYEKIANSLDVEGNFSLLPAIADPGALAGKLGVNIPAPSFPEGYVPYFTGQLVPKMAASLGKVGETELMSPIKLAAKLPSLVSPPQPPAFEVPPKLPLPASVTVVSNSPTPCLERVPPVIPQNALSTLATIHASAAEGIPKLIVQVISKMPSILAKLPKIDEAIAEICGLVRDSGIFGEIKDSSTTQKAATIVLSRKTSECILINAIANSVGSAPGSLTSSIAGVTSDNSKGPDLDRYDFIQQEPVIPPPGKPTPVQRALQRARELEGSFYGAEGNPKRAAYVNGLFYIEDLFSRTPNITINGTIPTENRNIKNYPGIESIVKLGPEEQNKYPVELPQGFIDYASDVAKESSSCGLFVRACYAAGGCINNYFLTLYPVSAAILGTQYIGSLRNYRWIKDNKNLPGIVDALRAGYFYFNDSGIGTLDEEKAKKNKEGNVEKIEITLNDILNVGVNNENGKYTFVDKFALIVNNKQVEPIEGAKTPAGKLLRAFLKPWDKRAAIGGSELVAIYSGNHPDYNGFPALEAGDAILVDHHQHILLLEQDRPAGFDITVEGKTSTSAGFRGDLTHAFHGIDGGQSDPDNHKSASAYAADNKLEQKKAAIEKLKQAQAAKQKAPYNVKTKFIDGESIFELDQVDTAKNYNDGSNWHFSDVTHLTAKGQSTAIRRTERNKGMKKDNQFCIGSDIIPVAAGQYAPDINTRPIITIFKGKNFLDPDENGEIVEGMDEDRKAYITKEAYVAANIMDLTGGLANITLQLNFDNLENRVFPTLSAIDGGRKQNAAINKNKAAKNNEDE